MKYLKNWLILNKKPLIYFIIIAIISIGGAMSLESSGSSCFGWGLFWGMEIEQHCLSKFQG